jgi:hypothetical protein
LTIHHAACCCGQLGLACEGAPIRVSVCHCLACQRRTGSAFGVQARFARGQVRVVAGRAVQYVRIGDSGGRITFHYCPDCGSTVFWEPDGLPDFVVVAVGAFADPGFPPPTVSIYEARQHPWVTLPGAMIEHLD